MDKLGTTGVTNVAIRGVDDAAMRRPPELHSSRAARLVRAATKRLSAPAFEVASAASSSTERSSCENPPREGGRGLRSGRLVVRVRSVGRPRSLATGVPPRRGRFQRSCPTRVAGNSTRSAPRSKTTSGWDCKPCAKPRSTRSCRKEPPPSSARWAMPYYIFRCRFATAAYMVIVARIIAPMAKNIATASPSAPTKVAVPSDSFS